MGTLAFLFIVGVIVIVAVILSRKLSKPALNKHQQEVVDSAQRLVDIINESLKIANESKNADTKVSRLDVAKEKLKELKRLSKEHSFIKLTQLPQAEQSIFELEREFIQAQYREGDLLPLNRAKM